MLIAISAGTLVGAVLGLRFKVLVLIPALILAVVITAIIAMAHGDHAGSAVLTVVFVVAALSCLWSRRFKLAI